MLSRLLAWAALYVVRTGGAPVGLISAAPSQSSLVLKASGSTTSMTALSGHTSREASLSLESVSLRLGHFSTNERNLTNAAAVAVGGSSGVPLSFSNSGSGSSKSSPLGGAGFGSPSPSAAAAMGADSSSGGGVFNQDIEYDEFGRAFVREVTVSRHELFYSVVQSVCYTLCFHGVELAEKQRESEPARANWETIVSSKYDPLRYCLKSVRIEFVRLAAAVGLFSARCWSFISTDLLYTDILLQQQQLVEKVRTSDNITLTTFTTNEATSHHTTSGNNNAARNQVQSQGIIVANGAQREVYSANTLDSFFPFDPCLLCKLHQRVQQAYRAWDGVPGLDDSDSHNDEYYVSGSEDEDEEEEDDDLEVSSREHKAGASHNIPMRRAGASRGYNGTPGSNASSMMDHFTTSSLSSVVSSIACTDNAMSIASSAHMSHMGSYAAGSFLSANMRENAQAWDEVIVPRRKGSDFDAEEEEEEEQSDSGMHEAHMHIPASQLNTSHGSAGSSGGGMGGAGAGGVGGNAGAAHEQFESNFRRPRFYSIGSTGSW